MTKLTSAPYHGLRQSSYSHKRYECKPQTMVGHCETKRIIKGKERYGCKKHRLKHAARHGAANKHTVPYKRRHAGNRYCQRPVIILMRGRHHRRLICKQREKGVAAYAINQGEAYCHAGSPPEQTAHRGAKSLMIARPIKLAAQSLAGISKAVHNIRE